METNDTSIICCFCGNRTQITSNIFNEFIEHLHICSSECFIPQKKSPSFYFEILNGQTNDICISYINKKSSLFYTQLERIMKKFEDKLKQVSITTLVSLIENYDSELENEIKKGTIKDVKVNCVCIKCLKAKNIFDFPHHVYKCILNELNQNSNTILIMILTEIISTLLYNFDFSNLNNKQYLNWLINQYEQFSPFISSSEIFCFICGVSVQIASFDIHYSHCRKFYNKSIKGLEKELEEPNNINIILNKIEKEETISEKELKEYALQAREIYNDLNLARCVRCGKHFSPDSIREHVKNCTKRRKKSDIEELNEYFDKEKRDKVIKRNRKSSMEHLKNIANEEIKYFHSLNVKIVQYRPKRSSKQIMENN